MRRGGTGRGAMLTILAAPVDHGGGRYHQPFPYFAALAGRWRGEQTAQQFCTIKPSTLRAAPSGGYCRTALRLRTGPPRLKYRLSRLRYGLPAIEHTSHLSGLAAAPRRRFAGPGQRRDDHDSRRSTTEDSKAGAHPGPIGGVQSDSRARCPAVGSSNPALGPGPILPIWEVNVDGRSCPARGSFTRFGRAHRPSGGRSIQFWDARTGAGIPAITTNDDNLFALVLAPMAWHRGEAPVAWIWRTADGDPYIPCLAAGVTLGLAYSLT